MNSPAYTISIEQILYIEEAYNNLEFITDSMVFHQIPY